MTSPLIAPVPSPTYAIVTFGCRVNQADSLAIEGDLRARGAECSPLDHAEVVIVNTCSVTASADQAARQTIRRISKTNPAARIIVTGCYATRRPDEVAALPHVVTVVPNTTKETLVRDIDAAIVDSNGEEEPTTAARFGDVHDGCGAALVPGVAGRTAFTLRVQTGCDQHCSYCIIPQTRGTGRSRPLPMVRQDIARAIEAGYKEVAITGVHLGSYGRDLADGSSLSMLVATLAGWDADVLFRISSLEPMDCPPEVVEHVATSPRLAPHFHLPLQHGSDETLRAMRRPYTVAYYRTLVEGIRHRVPHASIGSDIIVGFPGETDEQFERMREVVADLPLTHLHVFPYSDRSGTEASARRDKVDGVIIRERGRQMRVIGAEMVHRFRASQFGTTRRALTVDDGRSAVTDNYLKIALGTQHPRNEWVDVVVS